MSSDRRVPALGLMFASTAWTTPDDVRAAIEICEAAGVESVWAVEHVLTPSELRSEYPYTDDGDLPGLGDVVLCDPVVWLTYAAALSTTLRLGTGIMILPQRHPAYVAKEWATLDRLSGGRAMLGVGVGWLAEEMEAVGVPFGERGARTDEAIDAIRSLWTDVPSTVEGRFHRWSDMVLNPRPEVGSVPIVVGGHSPAAARRAARRGDGFFFPGSLSRRIHAPGDEAELTRLLEVLRVECDRVGRDPDEIEITVGAAGADAATVDALTDLGVDRVVVGAPPVERLADRLDAIAWLGAHDDL
ncbi:MAG: TIGR03619 family F420-dependent LLM class oxidoreductase [Acidimicrobiales bacterium]